MSKSNIVPLSSDQPAKQESPNRLSFTLEEMLKEFNNGAVPRSKYWRELITALYDTANHVVTGVTSVADVKPDNVGNIPLLPKDIDAPAMVRMDGADERERQSTNDVFGRQLFYGDACKVVHQYGHYYEVMAGIAYVAGIKFSYPGMQELLIDGEGHPISVWLDVSHQGDDISDIHPVVEVVVSNEEQKDYVDSSGTIHFLEKIAYFDSGNSILDFRKYKNYGSDVFNTTQPITHLTISEAISDNNSNRYFILIPIRNHAKYIRSTDEVVFDSLPNSAKFVDSSPNPIKWVIFGEESLSPQNFFDIEIAQGIDAIDALEDAASTCVILRKELNLGARFYQISREWVVPNNLAINSSSRCVITRLTSSVDHNGVILSSGNGQRVKFGVITAFGGDGLIIRGSVYHVEFLSITNCINGIVLEGGKTSPYSRTLDNVVLGVTIGHCSNGGIVFRQRDQGIVQQGNEFRINFITETPHTLTFDDLGTHTSGSNWDGNIVVLQASDPKNHVGASLCRNLTNHSVPALTYKIESWAGGWNLNDDTMVVFRGNGGFVNSTFEFKFANTINENSISEVSIRNSLATCNFRLKDVSNLVTEEIETSPVIGLPNFNGGLSLFKNKYKMKFVLPNAIGTGQTITGYIYHVLSFSSFALFFLTHSRDSRFSIIADADGTSELGLVRIFFTNISNSTIGSSETISYILNCGDYG